MSQPLGFPGGASGKEPACQCRRYRDVGLIPGSERSPGGGQGTLIFLPGESHGQGSLAGPWGHKESDTIERHHFHFSLACIGEGNGNPLQCSSLENPRHGGAWWAVICGVAQGRTRLSYLAAAATL